MGEVYKAEDLKLGRLVAIKVLSAEARGDDRARRRLLQEARAASALNHPNIVTVHAIEEIDGLDFFVMEYVEGESLAARLRRGPLDLGQVLDLGLQVADALTLAHASGLIHRDIKSSNILLTPRGRAKVVDFGLAKVTGPVEAPALPRPQRPGRPAPDRYGRRRAAGQPAGRSAARVRPLARPSPGQEPRRPLPLGRRLCRSPSRVRKGRPRREPGGAALAEQSLDIRRHPPRKDHEARDHIS
jgi:serine/threonine protein kinase